MRTNLKCRFVLLIIVILIPFFIHQIEHSNRDDEPVKKTVVSSYLCPQTPPSWRGFFRVEFADELRVDSSKICKSNDILLIYILSKIEHIDRRERIRQTWANKNEYEELLRTCFVFLIGQTSNASLNSRITFETALYGDLVQINISESERSIVYKEVGGLKWSYIYASHIPYLFKTDDDMIIDSLLLSDTARYFHQNRTDHSDYLRKHLKIQEFVREMVEVNKYTLFKGVSMEGAKTMREGKFALSYVAWNDDNLPDYCRGSGYMFSSFVRDRLYRASLCYALDYVPWVGDLFVSGFLATAAALRCSNWSMEYIESSHGCSARFQTQPRLLVCSTPMHLGRLDMEDYDRAWTVIVDRHTMMDETMEGEKEEAIVLLKKQSDGNVFIKESIIEQMHAEQIQRREAIVLLK